MAADIWNRLKEIRKMATTATWVRLQNIALRLHQAPDTQRAMGHPAEGTYQTNLDKKLSVLMTNETEEQEDFEMVYFDKE